MPYFSVICRLVGSFFDGFISQALPKGYANILSWWKSICVSGAF
jgi:hypothetical protein